MLIARQHLVARRHVNATAHYIYLGWKF